MSVSRFNSEGYHDPVVYEALTNMERQEQSAVPKRHKYLPLVYICSPYTGDAEKNAENARRYSRFAVECDAIPFAPHLLMPQYMDEGKERELALRMGIIFLSKCEQIWVFGDRITTGMAFEIRKATGMEKKDSLFYSRLQGGGVMKIAYGNSRMEKKWKNRDISWEDFCKKVSSPAVTTETVEEYKKMGKKQQDDIKDVGGFVGGHLKEGRRKSGTVLCRSVLTLDMDYGKALKKNIARDKVVIASKVYFNEGRLKREAIMREIDGTLQRLGTDYLDLYIIHRFDYDTPMEETMEALHDLVKAGKVRALGASAMYGYQFYNMQMVAKEHGFTPFSAMENHYNLLYREDERELIPICKQMGVSLMPYSPLAGGHLARATWESGTFRGQTDRVAKGKYDHMEKQDIKIVARVQELAEKYNCKMSQIALAWHFAKGVASPIIGATKTKYIDDTVGVLDIHLTDGDIAYLEEMYVPHPIIGAINKNPEQGVMLLDEKK